MYGSSTIDANESLVPRRSTRLQISLQRARDRKGPSVGQWLEFPGYSLARTVALLGPDVSTNTSIAFTSNIVHESIASCHRNDCGVEC